MSYRDTLLICYTEMIAADYILVKTALQLHMKMEPKEMDKYLKEGNELDREILNDSDDKVVKEINLFLTASDDLIGELEERNLITPDDIVDMDSDNPNGFRNKQVKVKGFVGLVIFMLTTKNSESLSIRLRKLCEIKNEVPPENFSKEWQYDDDNISTIATYYRKLCELLFFLEKETGSIVGKRNW